jgi:hypothetical protein
VLDRFVSRRCFDTSVNNTMSDEYDMFDSCLVDGEETSTKDLLKCISQNLRDHPGAQNFSRNVLLVYSAGKHENVHVGINFTSPWVSWVPWVSSSRSSLTLTLLRRLVCL